ncbi:MAG TPA: hypothetical protein VFD11_11640 [Thiopseudomonas sp.]|nr:hypothetical protein [Thiopseudomonas sp.]
MFKTFSRFALISTVLAVSACVIQPKTDEERVFELAEQRQAALLEYDFEKAYQYMSPGYRQLNTVDKFTSDHMGVYNWESSKVLKATCEEDLCEVNVEVVFDVGMQSGARGRKPEKFLIPRINKETWVRLDNKWWFSKIQ